MFNVIKGELVKKNTKPVIIRDEKIHKIVEEAKSKKQQKIEEEIEEEETLRLEIQRKKEELNSLKLQISNLKQKSKEEARMILEEAQERLEYEEKVSKNKGYQEGYQEGSKEGREEIVESAKSIMIRSQSIVEEAMKIKKNTLEENEKNIIEIALEIAKKIIKKEVREDKTIVELNLKTALKKIPISKKMTIILNWEDLEHVKEIKQQLISEIHGVDQIEIIEDQKLDKGGCILETSIGTIDASINSQIEILYENLLKIGEQEKLTLEENGSE